LAEGEKKRRGGKGGMSAVFGLKGGGKKTGEGRNSGWEK